MAFSDPFGLCVKDEADCERVLAMLRSQKGAEFQAAARRFDQTKFRVHIVSGKDSRLDAAGANSDKDVETWVGGLTDTQDRAVYLNANLSKGDFLVTAEHESQHLRGLSHEVPAESARIYYGDWRAFNQLSPSLRRGAVRESDLFFHMWGTKYGHHPVPGIEP